MKTKDALDSPSSGFANGTTNGSLKQTTTRVPKQEGESTDYSRWRLLDESGRHTWHYLTSDEQAKIWPQTRADRFHLGLETVGVPYHKTWLSRAGFARAVTGQATVRID